MLLNSQCEEIRTISSGSVMNALDRADTQVYAVIVDGSATSSVIRLCEEKGVKYLGARNFSSTDTKIHLVSL